MSLQQYHRDDRTIIQELIDSIYKLVANKGVPQNFDDMWQMVQNIMPMIYGAREKSYNRAVYQMHRDMRGRGLQIKPAPLKPYYANAAWKMLARALGWNPQRNPIHGKITSYDPEYQRELTEKVIPFPDNPKDPVVIDQVARRVAAGAARHARAAARDAVIETADLNQVKPSRKALKRIEIDLETEEEAEAARREIGDAGKVTKDRYIKTKTPGVIIGWARVLTGAENCAFCAMLASRGPVYEESTVLTGTKRSESRDGFSFHDHCDCKAVLVVKGQPWEGEEQFKDLQRMWNDARDNPTEEEEEEGLYSPRSRFESRYGKAIKKDPYRFSTFNEEVSEQGDGKVDAGGYPSEDGGTGLAGSVFESPGPDGFVLPAQGKLPEVKLHSLYGHDVHEWPRLEQPETMEEAAEQTARVNSGANCVRATAAAVARMKGYDVYPYATLYSSSEGGIQILQAVNMWETKDGPVHAIEKVSEEWESSFTGMPEGSYGVFSYELPQMAQRHVILWSKDKGKVRFMDPQSNEHVHPPTDGMEPGKPIIVARLDNATPVESKASDVIQPFSSQEVK